MKPFKRGQSACVSWGEKKKTHKTREEEMSDAVWRKLRKPMENVRLDLTARNLIELKMEK